MNKNTYKFRSECAHDAIAFIAYVNTKGATYGFSFTKDDQGPDCEGAIITSIALHKLVCAAHVLEDCHVIAETIALEGNYTGVRKTSRKLAPSINRTYS